MLKRAGEGLRWLVLALAAVACTGTPAADSPGDEPVVDSTPEGPVLQVRLPGPVLQGDELRSHFANLEACLAARHNEARCQSDKVTITDSRIEIAEKVFFETDSAVIDQRSNELLEDVAEMIMAHPELELIEVAGHADATGTDQRNLELTRERSQAVAARLVHNGVAATRLRSVGYSNLCPADLGRDDAANEKNRRVELVIIRRAGKQVAEGGGCPAATEKGIVEPVVGEAITEGGEPTPTECAILTQLPTPGAKARSAASLDMPSWTANDCDRARLRRKIAHEERVACGLPPNGDKTVLTMLRIGQLLRHLAAGHAPDDAERQVLVQRSIAVLEQALAIGEKYFASGPALELRDATKAELALAYASGGLFAEALAVVDGVEYPKSDPLNRAIRLPHAHYLGAMGVSGKQRTAALERALEILRAANQYDISFLNRERIPYFLLEAAAWRALGHEPEAQAIERWVASKATCSMLWPGDLRGFPDWIRGGTVTADNPETY